MIDSDTIHKIEREMEARLGEDMHRQIHVGEAMRALYGISADLFEEEARRVREHGAAVVAALNPLRRLQPGGVDVNA